MVWKASEGTGRPMYTTEGEASDCSAAGASCSTTCESVVAVLSLAV